VGVGGGALNKSSGSGDLLYNTYTGSVTIPPCAQTVFWNVVAKVYPIKQKYLDLFKQYKDLASASKFGVKKRVINIIDLYNERKIYNVKTATSLLNQLTDKKRKNVDVGIKRYNEVLDKFQNAEPLKRKTPENKAREGRAEETQRSTRRID
jgi:hypothetical protein